MATTHVLELLAVPSPSTPSRCSSKEEDDPFRSIAEDMEVRSASDCDGNVADLLL